MASLPYTFVGFFVLQLVFNAAESWCEHHRDSLKRARHGSVVVMVLHPTVVGGFHDLGIYIISEAHVLFAPALSSLR